LAVLLMVAVRALASPAWPWVCSLSLSILDWARWARQSVGEDLVERGSRALDGGEADHAGRVVPFVRAGAGDTGALQRCAQAS
jgi:hypothetical protein